MMTLSCGDRAQQLGDLVERRAAFRLDHRLVGVEIDAVERDVSLLAEPLGHGGGIHHLVLDRADDRDGQLRVDLIIALADQHGRIGLAAALGLAAGVIAVVEAVDPHRRDRQHVDAFGERDVAAGCRLAGEQRLEAGLGELRLEIARHFEHRGAGRIAVGDARHAALETARVGRLAVAERRRLQAHRVEILHLVAGDDAAGEAADAGKVPRARDVARLGERAGRGEQVSRERSEQGKGSQSPHRSWPFRRPSGSVEAVG